MKEERCEHLVKVLMIGESAVGKSCLIQRFTRNEFAETHTATIAIDFKMKVMEVGGVRMKMQIWDTAGQERFNTLTAGFFRGSDGIILCYSVADERSFQCVNKWMEQIARLAPADARVLLVANKSDIERERRVSREEGAEMAAKHGLRLIEASALNGEGVTEVFGAMAEMVLEKVQQCAREGAPPPGISPGLHASRAACCGGGRAR